MAISFKPYYKSTTLIGEGAVKFRPYTGTKAKTLEESTWTEIAQVSANKQWNAIGWKVGDTKTITLNGTVGDLTLNNYQCKVYILGFDHNSDKEGQGISFGMLEGMDGKQLALVDGNYNTITSSATAFTMNTVESNFGGWKNCHMRKTILGSTDVTNGDATSAAVTNPASGTLMAALPSDLRAVMKPITKYTNNVGGESGVSDLSATIDYLPLMGEYELTGDNSYYSGTDESSKQMRYQYYISNSSQTQRAKYKHNNTSESCIYYLRTPNRGSNAWVAVLTNGYDMASRYADIPQGIAPVFLV